MPEPTPEPQAQPEPVAEPVHDPILPSRQRASRKASPRHNRELFL